MEARNLVNSFGDNRGIVFKQARPAILMFHYEIMLLSRECSGSFHTIFLI